jgi:hypothetical protein
MNTGYGCSVRGNEAAFDRRVVKSGALQRYLGCFAHLSIGTKSQQDNEVE